MNHAIKVLAEAITHAHTQNLVESHVKELQFDEQTNHLIIYLDNAGPLHEFSSEEGDRHLNSGLSKIYGEDITYELRLHGEHSHEREKQVPHDINQ